MATVDTKHPDYEDFKDEWQEMRHTHRGMKAVKEQAQLYLPMPTGFTIQPDAGLSYYDAYRTRAQFPEIVSPTLRGMVGVIHKKEANITLPPSMMYLWERVNKRGLTLEALHRRLTAEVLLVGRIGLFATAPAGGGDPYLVTYHAESVINWSPDQDFFVLDETISIRNGYEWVEEAQFRILEFTGERYTSRLVNDEGNTITDPTTPTIQGGGTLSSIPFVIIGSRDLSVDPEEPPLIGVGRAALAAYRLDADYRHQLFNSGQETLFITGVTDDTRLPGVVGAGVVHGLPVGADAKYVGPSATTIEAHRIAILDERQNAAQAGARLFDAEPTQRVSGEALKFRDAARNATLATVSIAVAGGLERALRHIAVFMNEDPNQIIVKPNLDFVDRTLTAQDTTALVAGWQAQAFSYTTLYENLRRGGIASEERSEEDELALIKENPPPVEKSPAVPGGNNGQTQAQV